MNNSEETKVVSEKIKLPKADDLKHIIYETEIEAIACEIANEAQRKYRINLFTNLLKQHSLKMMALKKLRAHFYATLAICAIGASLKTLRHDDVGLSDMRRAAEGPVDMASQTIMQSEPRSVKTIRIRPSGDIIDNVAAPDSPQKHVIKSGTSVSYRSKKLEPETLGALKTRLSDEAALKQVTELLERAPQASEKTRSKHFAQETTHLSAEDKDYNSHKPKVLTRFDDIIKYLLQPYDARTEYVPASIETAEKTTSDNIVVQHKSDKIRIIKHLPDQPEVTPKTSPSLPNPVVKLGSSQKTPFASLEARVVPENVTIVPRDNLRSSQSYEEMFKAKQPTLISNVLERFEVPQARIAAVDAAFRNNSRITPGQEVRLLFADFDGSGNNMKLARVSVYKDGKVAITVAATDKGTFVRIPNVGDPMSDKKKLDTLRTRSIRLNQIR